MRALHAGVQPGSMLKPFSGTFYHVSLAQKQSGAACWRCTSPKRVTCPSAVVAAAGKVRGNGSPQPIVNRVRQSN